MRRLAKGLSAFTYARSAHAAGPDAHAFATRDASRDADGSGALAHALAAAFLVVLLALVAAPMASAAKRTDSIVAGNYMNDVAGGQLNTPRGVAVNATGAGPADAGDVYVVDAGNNRIQQFSAANAFIRAFGRDVVASSVNERQMLRFGGSDGGVQAVSPSGNFTLTFDPDGPGGIPAVTSAPIAPSNINQTTMDNNIDAIVGADANVVVTAGAGGVGVNPNTYVIEFGGAYAAADIPQLVIDGTNLQGGRAYISTLADGTASTGNVGTGFEKCTVISHCKAGLTAPLHGGTFSSPAGIAIQESTGDVFVTNGSANRVDVFTGDGDFLRAIGAGVADGGAGGSGDLNGTITVSDVKTTSKTFVVGQEVAGTDIPAGTLVTAVGAGTITLSQAATGSGNDVAIAAATASGNVARNEVQTVGLPALATGGSFKLTYSTPNPSNTSATTADIPWNASAAEVQTALGNLANVGAGNVAVTSSNPGGGSAPGGPYTIEYQGARFADTDVAQVTAPAGNLTNLIVSSGSKNLAIATTFAGASAPEVCATATACRTGLSSAEGGGFGSGAGHLAFAPAGAPHAGHLFVADPASRRIQQFEADGDWVRAWGWDVVQPGGTGEVSNIFSEQQVVTVSVPDLFGTKAPTGGNFTLTFGAQTTASIPYDAGAGVLQAALEALPTIGAGVTVTKPSSTTSWTVDFSGPLANTDVAPLTGNGAGLEGGAFGPGGTVGVTTQLAGGASPAFEVCTVAIQCKAAATSSVPANADGFFGSNQPVFVTVGPDGTLYASDTTASNRIARFDTSKSLASELLRPSFTGFGNSTTGGMAMTATGRLLLSRNDGASRVFEIATPAATPTLADTHYLDFYFSTILTVGILNTAGIAFNPANGDLFATSTGSGPRLYVADDDGAPPAAVTVQAPTAVESDSATLQAQITPGALDTFYRFQISGDGVEWKNVTGNLFLPEGNAPVNVQATASSLLPNNLYHVRVLTTKFFGANLNVASSALTFTTDAIPPSVVAVNADSITETSARLSGRINPHSTVTSYRFEYGVGNFDNHLPAVPAPLGSGSSFLFVAQPLASLQPGTTYQYRLTAISETEGAVSSPARTFTTRTTPAPPEDRAYELVSPPAKFSGNGVGSPTTGEAFRKAAGQAGGAGVPAYNAERFAVGSGAGAIMLDSAFSTASDWAFSERVSDSVGWRSHSPNTHPFLCSEPYRIQSLQQSSPDLSTVIWAQNGGDMPIFKEQCDMENANIGATMVSDWGDPPLSPTRWEPLGPFNLSQSTAPNGCGGPCFQAPAISADGTHLGLSGPFRGLLGPADPSLDTLGTSGNSGAQTGYVYDISAGLSDSFPGAAERSTVASCTGEDGGAGQDRTRVPARNADGSLGTLICEPPQASPPRSSRLVSDYGSRIVWQNQSSTEVGTSVTNAISADGSRVFFMAPDPAFTPNPGHNTCTTGTGSATRCPAQLYVRQRNEDGELVSRWVSRPDPGLLDDPGQAPLLGRTYFEGASADGSRVFFRTASPLTADDPNGATQVPPNASPATQRSETSWDLYMAELAAGPDPTGPGFALTRITAGPAGTSDCSVQPSSANVAALRFLSDDGARGYFVCAAPLGGVPDRDTGTAAGNQGGTPSTTSDLNLYHFDLTQPVADRYRFLARVPHTLSGLEALAQCATAGAQRSSQMQTFGFRRSNCWRGTGDGTFAIFLTPARLTKDDPDELTPSPSVDIYSYDATRDELIRISASQGALQQTYPCFEGGTLGCYAELGGGGDVFNSEPNPLLNVVTEPDEAGARIVYFQSASRLVDADQNDVFDVYQWRDGRLSLFSSGAPDSLGTAYKGNSADGRNVYLLSNERLTWQDVDDVADIYTARLGSEGIPEPVAPFACVVLADACQVPPSSAPAPSGAASGSFAGQGNYVPPIARCRKNQVRRNGKCVKKKPGKRKAGKKKPGKRTANETRRAHR